MIHAATVLQHNMEFVGIAFTHTCCMGTLLPIICGIPLQITIQYGESLGIIIDLQNSGYTIIQDHFNIRNFRHHC